MYHTHRSRCTGDTLRSLGRRRTPGSGRDKADWTRRRLTHWSRRARNTLRSLGRGRTHGKHRHTPWIDRLYTGRSRRTLYAHWPLGLDYRRTCARKRGLYIQLARSPRIVWCRARVPVAPGRTHQAVPNLLGRHRRPALQHQRHRACHHRRRHRCACHSLILIGRRRDVRRNQSLARRCQRRSPPPVAGRPQARETRNGTHAGAARHVACHSDNLPRRSRHRDRPCRIHKWRQKLAIRVPLNPRIPLPE